jgi:aminopeptidase YwaD
MDRPLLEIRSHLQTLCVDIGLRMLGSTNNQRAADYLRDAFLSSGLDVEEQSYSCTDWKHRKTLLEINGESALCQANAFCLPCDIRSTVVPIGTITELELTDIENKIVLFYGNMILNQLSPKSWFLKTERDDRIIQLLETKKPAAILALPVASVDYEQFTEDWDLDFPSATVYAEVAQRLIENPASIVHLQIDCERVPAQARNIVARSKTASSKTVVICAHFDTAPGTPGAMDNGASVAAMLVLGDLLSRSSLPCRFEFVGFNGEEALPMGDTEYLRRRNEDLSDIQLSINMDGIGSILGSNSVAIFSASEQFRSSVDNCLASFPGITWVDPWPESNHSTFAFRGVPTLAFSSTGVRHMAHTPMDTVDHISLEKVYEVVQMIEKILQATSTKDPGWFKPSTEKG